MADAAPGPGLRVTVVYAPEPQVVSQWHLVLAQGATVADALAQWRAQNGDAVHAPAAVGLWGRVVAHDTVLRDGDRMEVYRALKVDPKEARRQRFASQGKRSAGLFARK